VQYYAVAMAPPFHMSRGGNQPLIGAPLTSILSLFDIGRVAQYFSPPERLLNRLRRGRTARQGVACESDLPTVTASLYTWFVEANRTDSNLPVRWQDIALPPNLVSLSRVLITPVVGYFLARDDAVSIVIGAALLILAAISDGVDGYLARRLNMRSGLGLILDPLADKLFAAVLLIELVMFRGLPVWLAAVIVGRDLLIAAGGMLVLRRRKVPLASNVTGQYTFFSIVLLLGFYVVRFRFGIWLISVITVLLVAISLASYGYRFVRLWRGLPMDSSPDRQLYRILRVAATVVILAICAVMLVVEKWPQ